MRKVMWTVAGLAGMSLLLCGSGELLAQTDTATDTPGTADRDASDTRLQGSPTGDARVGTPGSAGFSSSGAQATGTAGGTGTGGAGTAGGTGTGGAGTDTGGAGTGTAAGAGTGGAGTGTAAGAGTGTGGAGTGTETGAGTGGAGTGAAAGAGTGAATTGAAGTGTGAAGAGQATGGAGAGTADQQAYVLQLESEVAQLRQEVAQLRAALADQNANTGVGGSGQAGVTPPVTTPRNAPLRAGTAQETNPRGANVRDTANEGTAVVNAIYTGTVRSVSGGRLELLDEAGQPFTMELGNKTRVLRDGKTISAGQLKQGTRVRVTVDMVSPRNQVMEIVTLPAR